MNKLDLKAYRRNEPQVFSLVPGINNINSVGGSLGVSRKSVTGNEPPPLTMRYDANKTMKYEPKYSTTLSSK